jgi:hypothetical protein
LQRKHVASVIAVAATVAVVLQVASVDQRPLEEQPFPDGHEYSDAARHLAEGDGYVTSIYGSDLQPPRFPPGYSLVLTPFAFVGEFPGNVQLGAKVVVAVYVILTVLLAWSLAGPLAAALAAVVLFVSPFAREAAEYLIADPLVAALTVACALMLQPLTRASAAVGGALGGFATATRLPAVLIVFAMLVAGRGARRTIALFALPAVIALAVFQWLTLGSPVRTGYAYWQLGDRFFSPSYLLDHISRGEGPFIIADLLDGKLFEWSCPCSIGGPQAELPNLVFYPVLLLGLFWVFAPPLLPLVGIVYAWRTRTEAVARFTLTVTVLNLLLFFFYYHQATRFMAGPATLLAVMSVAALAQLPAWLRARRNERTLLPAGMKSLD